MHNYYIDGKKVTKEIWKASFAKYPNASVELKTGMLPKPKKYILPECNNIIDPEKAKQLNAAYKEKVRQSLHNEESDV